MNPARRLVLYLAGPEVFLPDAVDVLNQNVILCEKMGFTAITPMDTDLPPEIQGMDRARFIYTSNRKLIDSCDIVLANCNSFRGAVVDDGTSWEIGYAIAQKKKVYGYIRMKLTLPEIVATRIDLDNHPSGYPVDQDGYLVNEDFGNSINLMLEMSIQESGGKLIEGNIEQALRIIGNETRSPEGPVR